MDPYLEWRLDIIGLGAGSNRGGIVHTDNNDNLLANIRFTKANMCSAKLLTDCFVEYTVDKKAGTTTIVFRTETNGKVRAN